MKLDKGDLVFLAKIKCCSCGSNISLWDAKKQINRKFEWHQIPMTGAVICGNCSHNLGLDGGCKSKEYGYVVECLKCGRVFENIKKS